MKKLPMRLAIRSEGNVVNAYLAAADTMADARLIGSLARGVAERADLFERWKALMTEALSVLVEEITGQRPLITETRAPEHERSGRT